MINEPVEPRNRPSDAYVQTLRDLGASEETIRLALGERRPFRWKRLWTKVRR